ncbi:uncharacterized protein B0H18DRAFT_1194575 [Fomitopsis serialis]|uniref:uncharacterized protein n=1 Tax=Fomitopsis serialis TaxID=139415 RepID=UPI0020080576|nr:uncharacterized protein B0H18DRAFT_1194575 [Neoantrodia serialis]KAH9919859.1 hypothetical protein B0H18DRAFT_1194575 [Neoantrodia serialis]
MPAEVTSCRTLPVETWDNIVDFLRNDRQALMTCSLTCRTLLPASQRQMFYHVCLDNETRYYSFNKILAERNYVKQYVRVLSICGDGKEDSEYMRFPSNGKWTHLLIELERLAHLRLRDFSCSLPRELRRHTGTLVKCMRTLDFAWMESRSDDLDWLISACSANLSILILFSTPASPGPSNSAIRTLVWNTSAAAIGEVIPVTMLMDWPMEARRCLRRLAITQIYPDFTPAALAQKLLSDSGDSLEHLFLDFVDLEDDLDTAFHLDFSTNSGLETLHIALPLCLLPDLTNALVGPLSQDMLRSLTSIVIRLISREGTAHQFVNWLRFCSHLGDICVTHPLINFTVCFDFRYRDGVSVPAENPDLDGVIPDDEVASITEIYADLTATLVDDLPPPDKTGGRVRFGIVWLWAAGESVFWTTDHGRRYPPEYFLGDPEWYYEAQAPWDF